MALLLRKPSSAFFALAKRSAASSTRRRSTTNHRAEEAKGLERPDSADLPSRRAGRENSFSQASPKACHVPLCRRG